MANYSAIRIKHLLQLCLWKNKLEPNNRGYETLVKKIPKGPSGTKALSKEYLANLWTDLNKAIESGGVIGKSEEHVQELLNECGFTTWDSFVHDYETISSFLIPEGNVSDFGEIRVMVLAHPVLVSEVKPLISFYPKIVEVGAGVIPHNPNDGFTLKDQLNDAAYVITYFQPNNADTAFENVDARKFFDLRSSKRLIPIWSQKAPGSKGIGPVRPSDLIYGLQSILLTILIVDSLMPLGDTEDGRQTGGKNGSLIKVKKNKGFIVSGDLKNENLNQGKTINISYGKKKKKKKE